MRMRVCDACGTPVADTWETCLRCGEELTPLPPPPPSVTDRARVRLRALAQRKSGAPAIQSVPTAAVPVVVQRHRPEVGEVHGAARFAGLAGLMGGRVPGWTFLPLVAAIVALLWIIVATQDDGSMQAARDAAVAEATVLAQSLERATAERDELRASVAAAEEQAARLEASVESGSADLDELQANLTAAEAAAADAHDELEVATETLSTQEARLAAFEECLDGMVVALAFAREGRNGAADVAMQSVADACAAAGG